jgi:endonuclease YncB( thermonuclease family)
LADVSVVDGDTLMIDGVTIRLLEIDTRIRPGRAARTS